jgi:hypothetical protein
MCKPEAPRIVEILLGTGYGNVDGGGFQNLTDTIICITTRFLAEGLVVIWPESGGGNWHSMFIHSVNPLLSFEVNALGSPPATGQPACSLNWFDRTGIENKINSTLTLCKLIHVNRIL